MKPRIITTCLAPESIPEKELTYVIVAARYRGKWIFVRHRDRLTWEMPAGHIEEGEEASAAAERELYEEAGAVSSSLVHLCDYGVNTEGRTGYGRLYAATVKEMEPGLHYETAEVRLSDTLPEKLTYPDVQRLLFARAEQHF